VIWTAEFRVLVWKFIGGNTLFGEGDKHWFVLVHFASFFVSSNVDFNPEYESLAQKSRDEEDKYFDSETPEIVASDHASDEEEEDELDVYMKSLKPDATPSELAENLSTIM